MSRKKCPINEKSLGGRLRIFRESKEVDIKPFSKLIGISHGTLSDIENNNTKPSAKPTNGLIRKTDINIYWLFTGEGEMIRKVTKYEPSKIKISVEIKRAIDILESNTIYSKALKDNIEAFYNALETEKKHSECLERIQKLEDRLAALEKEREPEKNPINGF